MAAGLDVLIGVRAIREAHARRTTPRYYLRLVLMFVRDFPEVRAWAELLEPYKVRPLLGTALEADRDQMDVQRAVVLDLATVLAPKTSRYLTLAARLTLGEDKQIASAVRELTPKVTAVVDAAGARKRKFQRVTADLQKAMEEFRASADKHLARRSRRLRRQK